MPGSTASTGSYASHLRSDVQVKAENFSSSKIPGDVAPKDELSPAIKDLAASGGPYVVSSTQDDLSDSSLADRKAAMEARLSTFGLAGKVEIDFFDSRRIAD